MRDSQAQWIPSPYFFPQRGGHVPRWLILHGTAGGTSAVGIADWFRDPRAQVSTNYTVDQAGVIVCSVDESDGPWANGALTEGHAAFWDTLQGINPNNVTISIEHVKAHEDNSDQLTPAQQAASFALIKRICQRWHIPMRAANASGGICGHCSLDPVNRMNCPGPFPWQALWNYLNAEDDMQIDLTMSDVAHYFVQAPGDAWHCPSTNYTIGNAMLDFYRSFGNSALCGLTFLGLPLSNEYAVPGYPAATEQIYERATLRYDPHHQVDNPPCAGAVYLTHVAALGNPPLAAALTKIIDLTSQLQSAESQLKEMHP